MSDFVYTKVEPNSLRATADNIDISINALENAFKSIEDTLNTSLQPTWSGPASNDFFKLYKQDTLTFVNHAKSLRAINNQLREAAGIFDQADNSAEEMVRDLKIGEG